jgi:hypothetical protein
LGDRFREDSTELIYGTVFTNQLKEARFPGGLPWQYKFSRSAVSALTIVDEVLL